MMQSRSDDLAQLPGWKIARDQHGALEDCSLVIATFMREQETLSVVETVSQDEAGPAEIVVVDGDPNSELGPKLRAWRAKANCQFDLLYVQGVRGLTLQRNAGIDISSRDLVFFLDDDAIPAPGYFRSIRNVFLAGANSGVGGVCGLVQTLGRRQMPRRWRIRFALGLVPRSEPLMVHPTGTSNPLSSLEPFEGTREVDYLPGCAFTFRREVLEANRFSEFFSGYSQGEDLEMSLRAGKSWKLLCCGEAPVTHLMVPGGRPRHFAKGKMDVINKHFLWKRHFPAAGILNTLRFWLDIGLIVLLDLASTVHSSTGTAGIAHAAGMTSGVWAVLTGASRYEEPSPKRQYELNSSSESA